MDARDRAAARSGVALVFVLWVMVLLSAVALEMAYRGHLRAQMTATTGESAKAFYLARAGIEQAMANLAASTHGANSPNYVAPDSEEAYLDIRMGEGSFTLYAGTDEEGYPRYGLGDECGKLNVNTVEASVLQNVPGLNFELAADITEVRKKTPFDDLEDLLGVQGVDALLLHGEDQNRNGLLDGNENDGDESWPPDDADGVLDEGLAKYLTTRSAARDVTKDGEERLNLNEASAETLTQTLTEIDSQQADSIVARRESGNIGSVLDLLDVDQVERVEATQDQQQQQQGNPSQEQNARAQEQQKQQSQGNENAKTDADQNQSQGQDKDNGNGDGSKGSKNGKNKDSKDETQASEAEQQPKEKINYKSTGKKAFDESTVRKIADRLTVSEDEVLSGVVNINTAPVEVLACLPGLDGSLSQAIVNMRDGLPSGFDSVVDLLDVSGMTVDILKPIYGLLTVRSDVYKARAIGALRGGAVRSNVCAILDRTEDEVQLRYWQEND